MSIFRVLAVLALLMLALIVIFLGYLHFADLNRHRSALEGIVSEATGRQFRIGGDLDLALLPAVGFQVDDLELANADWGTGPTMVNVGHLLVRVKPLSLLFGPVDVIGAELNDVGLLVENNAAGESNWTFPEAAPDQKRQKNKEPKSREEGGISVTLDDVQIKNILVTRRSPGAEDQTYRLEALEIQADGADQMILSGSGELLTLPLTFSGTAGTRKALAEVGSADFNISAVLGELDMELAGSRAAPGSDGESRMQAVIRSDELAAFLESLDMALPLAGPLSVTADITGDEGSGDVHIEAGLADVALRAAVALQSGQVKFDGQVGNLDRLGSMFEVSGLPASALGFGGVITSTDRAVQLTDTRLTVGDAQASVNGTLRDAEGSASLQIEVKGQSLATLMTTLPVIPFEASAAVGLASGSLGVEPLAIRFGNSDLKGSVRVATGGSGNIEADLSSQRLDLTEFSGGEETAAGGGDPGAAEEAPGTSAPPEEAGSDYVFREDPLPLDMLRSREVDVRLSVGELSTPALTLENLETVGTLHDGNLEITADFTTPKGGSSASSIQLQSLGEQASLAVDIKARDLRINFASGDVEDDKDIPPTSLTIDMTSSGISPRTLAANSNGTILVTLGPGKIDAKMIQRTSGDILSQLFSAVNPLAEKEPRTRFECGVIVMDFKDGLGKMNPLMLQGQKLLVTAGGTLDLSSEKLNFEFNTKPREGVGLSADMFVTPFVSLGGTLASPGIGLNKKGTLLNAGAAVATGGLSFLWKGLADRAAGALDQCKETMPQFTHPPMKGG